MKHYLWLVPVLILCFSTGCSPQATDNGILWPVPEWQTSTPAEQSLDTAILDEMLVHISETQLNLHSLLVIRHGAIVLEKYYPPFDQDSQHVQYSVTKSFIATLVGVAIDQQKLSLNQPVQSFFPDVQFTNLSQEKEDMKLVDLLTMTSGLAWEEGDPSFTAMYRSRDWSRWVMDLPMAGKPGEIFRYCSGCSHVLSAILEQATGEDGIAYARKYLFEPLGIRDFRWEKDSQGIPIGGWGLYLTPRDMARLGLLYLHEGQWQDRQVVSKNWVREATSRKIDTDGRLGYGYQWWVYPTHGAYAALGRDGQTIFVLPDLDIILVTTAEVNGHDAIFELVDQYIIPAATD